MHLIHQVYAKEPSPLIAQLPIKRIFDMELTPIRLTDKARNYDRKIIGLEELMSLIRPHHCVEPRTVTSKAKSKSEDIPRYCYRIVKIEASSKKTTPNSHKRAGRDEKILLTPALAPRKVRQELRTACASLEKGSRVEFHLRARADNKDLTVDWALQNLPYLRPDVILKSMPEGTKVIIPPVEVQGQQELIWAFSLLEEDLIFNGSDSSDSKLKMWTMGSHKYRKAVRKSRTLLEEQAEQAKAKGSPPREDALADGFVLRTGQKTLCLSTFHRKTIC